MRGEGQMGKERFDRIDGVKLTYPLESIYFSKE